MVTRGAAMIDTQRLLIALFCECLLGRGDQFLKGEIRQIEFRFHLRGGSDPQERPQIFLLALIHPDPNLFEALV